MSILLKRLQEKESTRMPEEKEPEKEKERCPFCGKDFVDIARHVKKCSQNPETVNARGPSREEIMLLIDEMVSKKWAELQSEMMGSRKHDPALAEFISLWHEMVPAMEKRWKKCKGYMIVIKKMGDLVGKLQAM